MHLQADTRSGITQGHEYPTDLPCECKGAGTLAVLLKEVLDHPEGACDPSKVVKAEV